MLMVLEPTNIQRGLPKMNSKLDLTLFGIGALLEIKPNCHFLKDFPWLQLLEQESNV